MKLTKTIGLTLAATILTGIASLPAAADGGYFPSEADGGRMYAQAGGGGWQGGVQYYDTNDNGVWRSEYWQQGVNDGAPGWWWVSSHPGMFKFYTFPMTYQPQPPVLMQSLPPNGVPVQYWYYCFPSWGFNPFMPSCMVGWKRIAP